MEKECVYVIMLKIALLLVKIYVLLGKKGYKWISVPGSSKTKCFLLQNLINKNPTKSEINHQDFKKLNKNNSHQHNLGHNS